MQSRSDTELMLDYAEGRSEAAFAELVRRYINLVYSAAFRMTRDPHLAQDVTQGAFSALAKNARQIAGRPVLSAWLHTVAQNIAAQSIRTEIRRRAREKEAHAMNISAEPDASWEEIAPHLDHAVGQLSEPDRDAVMLRYFEDKTAREIAQHLNISEEAAQKRVHRAVERLREFFAKQGVAVTAGGFAAISAQSVQAAPVGLAAAISSAALLTGAAVTSSLVTTTVNTVAWMNAKSLATAAVAAFVAGGGVYVTKQIVDERRFEEHRAASQAEIASLQKALEESSKIQITDAELNRLRSEQSNAIKLRGEITGLKQSLAIAQKAARQNSNSSTSQQNLEELLKTDPLPESNPEVRVHSTKVVGTRIPPDSAVVVGGWVSSSGRRLFAFIQPTAIDAAGNKIQPGSDPSSASQVTVSAKWAEIPFESAEKLGLGKYFDAPGEQILTVNSVAYNNWVKQLELAQGVDLLSSPMLTTVSGRQASISVTETKPTAAGPVDFGPQINVIPTVDNDGAIELVFKASLTEAANPPAAPAQQTQVVPAFRTVSEGNTP